jgi:hypothetical protein
MYKVYRFNVLKTPAHAYKQHSRLIATVKMATYIHLLSILLAYISCTGGYIVSLTYMLTMYLNYIQPLHNSHLLLRSSFRRISTGFVIQFHTCTQSTLIIFALFHPLHLPPPAHWYPSLHRTWGFLLFPSSFFVFIISSWVASPKGLHYEPKAGDPNLIAPIYKYISNYFWATFRGGLNFIKKSFLGGKG